MAGLHKWLVLSALLCSCVLQAREACFVAEQAPGDVFRFQASAAHEALAEAMPEDAVINSLRFRRLAVFDESDSRENSTIYRWANDFHSVTREWVLREQLLVTEGDRYERRRLEESERILRQLKFIYDARVRPWRRCGDRVDLEIVTRDIWTFLPSVSLGRSGGQNDWSLGFRDSNFLGTGKQVLMEYDSDDERSGYTLAYTDPALLGSRWRLRARYTDNDDGYDRNLRIERPFFSIYENWSAGAEVGELKLEEKLWSRGDETAEFDHELDVYRLFGGVAASPEPGRRVNRWLLGYNYERHNFDFSDSGLPPAQLPQDRTYSYPWLGYQSVEDEFAELHNFDYLGRTEDVFVGERYRWSFGYSTEGMDATRDQIAFEGNYENTLLAEQQQLWVIASTLAGYWTLDDESFENLWWQFESRYHLKHGEQWAFYSGLRLDYTDGLTADRQLVLGGDNGLRGYDRNYQTGDRSFVLNLEERYYSNWHPFRLVRVGVAAFVDIGRAWYENRDNGSNGDVLANAGFGLRLNSSRAEKSAVVHVDLAFPFVRDDDVDDVQLLITVKERF